MKQKFSYYTKTKPNRKTHKKKHEFIEDEVRYWFDVLENNSIDNIAKETGYSRTVIGYLLNDLYKMKKQPKKTA